MVAGVALFYCVFCQPIVLGIDGNDMLAVAKSLVTDGDFAIAPTSPFGVPGRGGELYSSRYPLLPVMAAPLVGLGMGLDRLFGLPEEYILPSFTALSANLFSVLVLAATAALTAALSRRFGSTYRGAYGAALALAFGTSLLVYGRMFYADPLLGLITAACLYMACDRRRPAWLVLLAGLGVLAKPAGILLGPVIALYLLLKRCALWVWLSPLTGSLGGLLVYMGYNHLRFGDWLTFGQDASRFTLAGISERAWGLVFSPGVGGGLLWYCPVVPLAALGSWYLIKRKALEVMTVWLMLGSYVLLHACWSFGGWNWGPRFLLPTLPGLCALAGASRLRKGLLVLVLVGLLANGSTLGSLFTRYYYEKAAVSDYQALALQSDWRDAPLFNGWQAASRQLRGTPITVTDTYRLERVEIVKARLRAQTERVWPTPLMYTLPLWWWTLLPRVGVSGGAGLGLAIGLAVASGWCLAQGWRTAGRLDRQAAKAPLGNL